MEDCKEPDILTVTTTVGSRADAERLARRLLERRLAACVQLDEAVTSVYRWQGRLCADPEVRLVIKTLPECEAALQAFVKDRLAPFKYPRSIEFIAELPKTATGKIQRFRLRERERKLAGG